MAENDRPQAPPTGGLSLDEAERLASQFTPLWEMPEGDAPAAVAPRAPVVASPAVAVSAAPAAPAVSAPPPVDTSPPAPEVALPDKKIEYAPPQPLPHAQRSTEPPNAPAVSVEVAAAATTT